MFCRQNLPDTWDELVSTTETTHIKSRLTLRSSDSLQSESSPDLQQFYSSRMEQMQREDPIKLEQVECSFQPDLSLTAKYNSRIIQPKLQERTNQITMQKVNKMVVQSQVPEPLKHQNGSFKSFLERNSTWQAKKLSRLKENVNSHQPEINEVSRMIHVQKMKHAKDLNNPQAYYKKCLRMPNIYEKELEALKATFDRLRPANYDSDDY